MMFYTYLLNWHFILNPGSYFKGESTEQLHCVFDEKLPTNNWVDTTKRVNASCLPCRRRTCSDVC